MCVSFIYPFLFRIVPSTFNDMNCVVKKREKRQQQNIEQVLLQVLERKRIMDGWNKNLYTRKVQKKEMEKLCVVLCNISSGPQFLLLFCSLHCFSRFFFFIDTESFILFLTLWLVCGVRVYTPTLYSWLCFVLLRLSVCILYVG